MKIYLKPKRSAFCLKRIEEALRVYLPSQYEITEDYNEADHYIMYITGSHDHRVREAHRIIKNGKSYSVIQLVLESSRNPRPEQWHDLWEGAANVWSYYDLGYWQYKAPLGPGSDQFYPEPGVERIYQVGSLGDGAYYKAECYGELHWALWNSQNGRGVHVGENMPAHPIIDYLQNPDDSELRMVYNQCKWFSCLRRKDGFEMPAIEALLCGSRPIMFDTPNYRQWFDGLVKFIPEQSPGQVADTLLKILQTDPDPVTEEERADVLERFDWEPIITGFYSGISSRLSSPEGGSSGP